MWPSGGSPDPWMTDPRLPRFYGRIGGSGVRGGEGRMEKLVRLHPII